MFAFLFKGVSWNLMISHLCPPQSLSPSSNRSPSLSLSLPLSLSLVQRCNAPLASQSFWWSGGCESYLIFQRGVWSWTEEAGTITGSGQRKCWAGLITFELAWLSSEQLCGSSDRFTCSWKQTPLTWDWGGYNTTHLLKGFSYRGRLLKGSKLW